MFALATTNEVGHITLPASGLRYRTGRSIFLKPVFCRRASMTEGLISVRSILRRYLRDKLVEDFWLGSSRLTVAPSQPPDYRRAPLSVTFPNTRQKFPPPILPVSSAVKPAFSISPATAGKN